MTTAASLFLAGDALLSPLRRITGGSLLAVACKT